MITQDFLKQNFKYNPETGIFIRLTRPSTRVHIGDCVGSLRPDGYLKITIDKKNYLSHRLAWLYMTGKFPKEFIDHVNMIRSDNRFINLREATQGQNYFNSGCRSHSKIGLKGVTTNGDRWQAQIRKDKRRIYLGTYDSPQEAHESYVIAAHKYHGEFARTE